MEKDRIKRYKDKIDLASKRIEQIEEWKDQFLENEKSALACYKAYQEIVEAVMDIVAMLIKDRKSIPKDDYSNIDNIMDAGIITKEVGDSLKEANGLRNRIIHHYNGLSSKIAYESILNLLPVFEDFLETVEKWLKKN